MTLDINELRRLAQAATPGPWKCEDAGFKWIISKPGDGYISREVCKLDGSTMSAFRQKENGPFIAAANPTAISELLNRLEAAEKDVALKERVIDVLGSELNAVANERDALRTVLTDLLNDLEERAKWNLEESQRVVACGNGVYMRAKAALEESK